MTGTHRHRPFYGPRMRGADWASVGYGGRPGEAGIIQEQDMLRQPATRCYSYTSTADGGSRIDALLEDYWALQKCLVLWLKVKRYKLVYKTIFRGRSWRSRCISTTKTHFWNLILLGRVSREKEYGAEKKRKNTTCNLNHFASLITLSSVNVSLTHEMTKWFEFWV